MSAERRDRSSDAVEEADDYGSLRPPKSILRRGLLGGVAAGGLLGALMVLPGGVRALSAPDPETYAEPWWSWLVVTVPVGALVGFMPALLALVVWEWQLPRGTQRARVAGSATAALAVVATAAVFQLLAAVGFVAVAAVVSFVIAYLSVPIITTRRPRRRLS